MDDAMAVAQRAFDKISSHEVLCAERWGEIRDDVRELKTTVSTFSKFAVGVMVALLGWGGAQLYGQVAPHSQPAAIVEKMR